MPLNGRDLTQSGGSKGLLVGDISACAPSAVRHAGATRGWRGDGRAWMRISQHAVETYRVLEAMDAATWLAMAKAASRSRI